MNTSAAALQAVHADLQREHPHTPYRIVVIHRGRLLTEWNNVVPGSSRERVSSVVKSLYVSILGIMLDSGVIGSLDEPVRSYAPWMMDIGPSEGPRADRYVTEQDGEITFRHIITHFSGYLKPEQRPGEKFHYQTFSMNLLAHTLAHVKGRYDPYAEDDLAQPGMGSLIRDLIRDPIGAGWQWAYGNFPNMQGQAKTSIFGNNTHIYTDARDLGRLGWLWCSDGNWFGTQVIPSGWIDVCTQPAGGSRATESEEDPSYGQGFWINHRSLLWPDLPEDSFAAWGRGGHNVWVSPANEFVVVTSPRPVDPDEVDAAGSIGSGVVARIVGAVI